VIEAQTGVGDLGLRELWAHRELVAFFVWRDFKVRYRQTILGVAWAILQPLLTAAVLTIVFSRLADVPSDGVPYPLFVLAGLMPWQFFTHGVSAATGGLVWNQDLVRRVYFPRLAIPLANVLSGAPDLLIGLLLVLSALAVYGWTPPLQTLLVPLPLLLGFVTTLGIGLVACAANTQYRDVGHAVPFGLQLALFASPIIYPSSALPPGWRAVYSLNPMVGVVDSLRWCLFDSPLRIEYLLVSVATALIALVGGLVFLRRVERRLADVL
jgi:lipopolysaccharide transport system permease protein